VTIPEQALYEYLRIHGEQQTPHKMIEALKRNGYTEGQTRTALWYLIDKQCITLTPNRTIRLAGTNE
jgi:hypothetical protein